MYDVGFPFPRSWLYGLGGFLVALAAFAVGILIASSGRRDAVKVDVAATIAANEAPDDVIVVQAAREEARFPAFAPEGIIVVDPPAREERMFADATRQPPVVERASSTRRAQRRARSNVTRPATAERADPSIEEVRAEEPRQLARPTTDEPPAAREGEDSGDGADESAPDSRSWYGSAEYRREVAERRRAEREARRRRNEGWW